MHQKQIETPRQDRWFFSFGYGRNRPDVEQIKSLIDIGAAHGLNGMVLSSFGLDSITRWDKEDIGLLQEIAAHCEEQQIELIPTGFSVGYGGGALGYDRSFAAALPIRIPMKATSGKILPVDKGSERQDVSLSDIARREGTPLELRSQDRDIVFVEGRDFETILCLRKLDHLTIPTGSSVQEGENLVLSCYKIPYETHPWGRQTSLCMSNPKLYDYWEAQARRLHQVAPFKRVLLSMDEIRNGGGCVSCQKRGLSMAEILGDCITRQQAIFKAIDPGIEVLIWSDMLDPAHNARNNYYGVVGNFTGSWKHVPPDLGIMCWYHDIRDKSLEFFSSHGFRTFGAAYYDADDLTHSKEWIDSLRKTPNAQGIMYTTWEKKYRLLGDFGDLLSEMPNE